MKRREFIKNIVAATAFAPELVKSAHISVERKEETSYFEKVKKNCGESIKTNKSLREQIGEEGIEKLIEMLKDLEVGQINEAIKNSTDLEEGFFDNKDNQVGKLDILSEEDIRNLGLPSTALGQVISDNGVVLRARAFLPNEGINEKDLNLCDLEQVFRHEYCHICSTTTGDSEESAKPKSAWVEGGNMKNDFYEGMTELQATKILPEDERRKIKNHAFKGGWLMTAYLVNRVVGDRVVNNSYYNQEIDELRGGFDRKMGLGSFDKLFLSRDKFREFFSGNMDDLDTLVDLLNLMEERGVDFDRAVEEASDFGIKEDTIFVKGEEGKFLGAVHLDEYVTGGLTGRSTLVSEKPLDLDLFPIKVRIGGRGNDFDEQDLKDRVKRIAYSAAKEIEYGKRGKQVAEEEKRFFEVNFEYDYNIESFPDIGELMNKRNQSENEAERKELESKIRDKLVEKSKEIIRIAEKELDKLLKDR